MSGTLDDPLNRQAGFGVLCYDCHMRCIWLDAPNEITRRFCGNMRVEAPSEEPNSLL
jgi:hypothetical protein